MTPLAGQPILTAAQMRTAEDAEIANGATVESLMARAGQQIAAAVRRLAGASPILILCGPGNNGGDGYVAARLLGDAGLDVRVAALADPKTDAATAARAGWQGAVERFADAEPSAILIDALFGTSLTRPVDPAMAAKLAALVADAQLSIAVDLPSGVATDDGKVLGDVPTFDVTLALGAAKPSHLLQPAARHCGDVRVLDIGVAASSAAHVLARPYLPDPGPDSHKYTRGMVAIIGGAMPGAARLASIAAMRAGAGYVLLLADTHGPPDALVHTPFSGHAIADPRIGALLIGPGLGRDDDARGKLHAALATPHPLVIDGDALHLLDLADTAGRKAPVILTPHAGEFDALFGKADAGKIDRTRDAANRSSVTVVFKGADTVIAAADGRVRVSQAASVWLSTAGTGDVLAGTIAATLSAGLDPLDAAAAGVWLHGEAARRLGPAFIADDLAHALTDARASL
ncbi:carbohydrate kinase [Sphingomonas sp. Leaf357]|uniref:bifunctional ADP-dependent NAD(P)H-hydrate dehydratase/NAD(P)H-hydrate epimerase n=1 Tax=Sphingomonas sp. Leaf357 TaxID=1736350 RepID=UPI0006FE4DF0|nr:bifunctional ADP-dependent NAD(P)H-hydrate dehydratase/NAD(P)H-hydrate epimerase [Sphingomonas sp. Leaf357]KQS04905.1 carbohydrate kinase [Sphingomonas sp. Leaf357]